MVTSGSDTSQVVPVAPDGQFQTQQVPLWAPGWQKSNSEIRNYTSAILQVCVSMCS